MRIRVSKLVYLPVGGALGAGLLVSAFVVPQPKLAASSDCYSSCNSATSLSLSKSTVVAGRETEEEFRVKVTGDAFGNPKPTGAVDVEADGRVVCHLEPVGRRRVTARSAPTNCRADRMRSRRTTSGTTTSTRPIRAGSTSK